MNNFLLTAALEYAQAGYSVFPCLPRGKKPILSNGFHGATKDTALIRAWWDKYPNANIGMPTGEINGLVVIDVDQGGQDTLNGKGLTIPEGIEQTTPHGSHHLFKHPGHHVRSATGNNIGEAGATFDHVDSRADGGYIIVAPSINNEGDSYTWEIPLLEEELTPAPEWWIEALQKEHKKPTLASGHSKSEVAEGGRNDFLAREAGRFRKEGHGVDAVSHMIWGINIEQCNPPLSEQEVKDIAVSVCRYATFEQENADSIKTGQLAAQAILESHQLKVAEELDKTKDVKAGPAPSGIIPEKGLIKDIVDYILSQSRFPRPELALAATVSFLGAVMGQKYQTETGLRSNVYFAGIAKSGFGKDTARKKIKSIAEKSDTYDWIGEERIASGQGLLASVEEKASKLFMLDEFGRLLQSITGNSADGYKKEIMTNLMQLYSSAGSTFHGTAYADRTKKPVVIKDPCCVVYGTSTPESFYSALSSAEAVGGEISRFLIVASPDERGEAVRYKPEEPSSDICARVSQLAKYFQRSGNLNGVSSPGEAQVVEMRPEIMDAWDSLDSEMTLLMHNDATSSIYSRVAENAAKLALIYAVSISHVHPKIGAEAFTWGRELAMWSANTLVAHLNSFMADNETEKTVKRVARIINKAGENGITKSVLTRKTQWLKQRDRSDVLETLLEAKTIVSKSAKLTTKNITTYVHADFV